MNAIFERRARLSVGMLAAVAAVTLATDVSAAPVVRLGSGANSAALQPTLDQFRADLGGANNPNNGVSFPDGRREINWDGVPDNFSAPNNLPPNFFNVNSPRGAVFHTVLEDNAGAQNQFMVSATTASGTPVRFGDINGTYPAIFTTNSAQRLFMPRGGHALMVKFYKPGTTVEATTKGFGAVFVDVDGSVGADRTAIYLYGTDGSLLSAAAAPPFNGGLSFVGVSFDNGERIGHVVIKSGTRALGPTTDDGDIGVDLVPLDDFIYGEPQPVTGCVFADGFDRCPASR